MQKNFRRTLFKVNNVQMTTITKSKSVSFSFLSRPTYPVLLLIFYLQQEIKVEWPNYSFINLQSRLLISILLFYLLKVVIAFCYAIRVIYGISKIRSERLFFMFGSISVQNMEPFPFSIPAIRVRESFVNQTFIPQS